MRRSLVAVVLALSALVLPSLQAAATTSRVHVPIELHRQGRFLADAQGRIVMLHGVNAVWKIAPFVPPTTAAGFTAKDADFIAAQGWNVVRLGVLFAGVMPQRGVIDQGYLDKVAAEVKLLTDRKIWVLLDFHQDMYSEKFYGEGFPSWAVDDDGLPTPANAGFPGNYFQPSTTSAFDNLYANKDGLADEFAAGWKAVAQKFNSSDYILGYDLLNEPWPGSSFATCANPAGCPVFDQTVPQPFYEKSIAAIRTVDPHRIAFMEPQDLFADGAQTNLNLKGNEIGLSFHEYCTSGGAIHSSGGHDTPDCKPQGNLGYKHAIGAAQRNGWAALMTEFGATDDLSDVSRVTLSSDQSLSGWIYWAYKNWGDPTTESASTGAQGIFANDTNLATAKQAKLDLLDVPYAQAIAGTPTYTRFTDGVLHLMYQADPATGLTEIYVPKRQFPKGYTVAISGGTVVSKPAATEVLVRAKGKQLVRLSVSPTG